VYEVLRRVLGIDDMYFGVPATVDTRLARLEDTPPPAALVAARADGGCGPPNLPENCALFDRPEVRPGEAAS
jgi:hypothetical protein